MKTTPYFETNLGKLYHGDCLELLPEIPDESIDMILCDLPYGITHIKWDKKISLELLFKEYNRVITQSGAIVLTGLQPFLTEIICGLNPLVPFRQELIWEKTHPMGFLDANRRVLRAHENILIFYKHLPTYNPQMTEGRPYHKNGSDTYRSVHYNKTRKAEVTNNGNRYPCSVIKFSIDRNSKHPTSKPQALFEWLIKTYTNEGMLVLDNCIGGGTTAAACEKLNRYWVGMEISEEYCAMTKERLTHDTEK